MNQELQEHYDDQDIIKLNIRPETEKWNEELHFIQKEIGFYRLLLKSDLIEKTSSNPEDSKFLFQQLEFLQRANDLHIQTLVDFKSKLEGMKECDDVQCENFYIKDHLVQKEIFQKHFRSFRSLKEYIYKFLDRGLRKVSQH